MRVGDCGHRLHFPEGPSAPCTLSVLVDWLFALKLIPPSPLLLHIGDRNCARWEGRGLGGESWPFITTQAATSYYFDSAVNFRARVVALPTSSCAR
jgi:hypothetical protein